MAGDARQIGIGRRPGAGRARAPGGCGPIRTPTVAVER